MWFPVLIGVLVSYFLGNLNGAVLISAMMHDDVRSHGSGNAGLTNFIRNYGAGRAIYVVFIDAGKAILGCLVTALLLEPYGMWHGGLAIGGAAVMVGHMFPVLLGFHGGKGILSGLFVALCTDWRVALVILAIFAVVYFATRYVSLSSIVAALSFSLAFAFFYYDDPVVAISGVCVGLLAVFMHRANIVRLVKGQERKTDLFSKGKQV
jgi:glycerol-3-phosphate acyltransferase PlsY